MAGYDVGFGKVNQGDLAGLFSDRGTYVETVRVTDVTQDGGVSFKSTKNGSGSTVKWESVRSLKWCERVDPNFAKDVSLIKASSSKIDRYDFYARFAAEHSMSRGEAKLYVLGQIYGKDYDPGDARNEALREAIIEALNK